jgi:hypothetical protein
MLVCGPNIYICPARQDDAMVAVVLQDHEYGRPGLSNRPYIYVSSIGSLTTNARTGLSADRMALPVKNGACDDRSRRW